jgi:hypothetical protein
MKFEDLSFVGADDSGEFPKVDPWKPTRTGDYATDCSTGRKYFNELLAFIERTGNPTLLCRVLSAQVRGGVWNGVEIGFAQAMGEMLQAARVS